MPIQVRRVEPSEHPLVRALRLQALRDAPGSFAESASAASEHPERYWVALTRAVTGAQAMFVVEVDGQACGSVYGLRDDADPEGARVGGMWVASAARGEGHGRALLRAVLEWAAAQGCARVRLWVPADSPAACGLYSSAGFAFTGATKVIESAAAFTVREMRLELGAPP